MRQKQERVNFAKKKVAAEGMTKVVMGKAGVGSEVNHRAYDT